MERGFPDPGSADGPCCQSILVIEDDEPVREAMADVLIDAGYRVDTASNGREGLARLSAMAQPCLILLDLMMPVMTGVEFLRVLREQDAFGPIPVVVCSAWPNEAARARGAQGFVKKPFDVDTLMKVVEQHC